VLPTRTRRLALDRVLSRFGHPRKKVVLSPGRSCSRSEITATERTGRKLVQDTVDRMGLGPFNADVEQGKGHKLEPTRSYRFGNNTDNHGRIKGYSDNSRSLFISRTIESRTTSIAPSSPDCAKSPPLTRITSVRPPTSTVICPMSPWRTCRRRSHCSPSGSPARSAAPVCARHHPHVSSVLPGALRRSIRNDACRCLLARWRESAIRMFSETARVLCGRLAGPA
jgi:hypothetical protein